MPSLLLHAADQLWQPDDAGALATRLLELGLIDSVCVKVDQRVYPAGDKFLQLITFLGCSPEVALRPDDARSGQEICTVGLISFDDTVFLASHPLPQARCGNCRAALTVTRLQGPESLISCGRCGTDLRLDQVDWRKAAGSGRFFVEVKGIFPHEALPSEKLLNELAAYSKCQWAYFYVNGRSCVA